MRAAILFAIIAALAIVGGAFSTTRHQAEREAWRLESQRLTTRISDLEGRLDAAPKHDPAMAAIEDRAEQEIADADARLALIEAEILENRTVLVQLKSDRIVADEHTKLSLERLRQQARKTAEIELLLADLQSRRLEIEGHIADAEEQVGLLSETITARQDYAGVLDQKLADLAIRREVASARLDAAGQDEDARETVLDVVDDREPAAEEQTADNETPDAPAPMDDGLMAAIATPVDRSDQDRSKGLYRFRNLSADVGAGGPAVAFDQGARHAARTDVTGREPEASAGRSSEARASDAWASEQYELGRALVARGARNSGTRELNEAVLAFRAALGEWPKDQDSRRWATAQSDLGHALALLGQREGDVVVLEEAAAACRGALSTLDRGETPLLWANAQFNLGLSLSGMARIKEDRVLWENAIEALQQSAETFEDAGASAEADKATRRLREAHDHLGALKQSS